MEKQSSVLGKMEETTLAKSEKFQLLLSWEETELVRSGLETLLQIYTRHERYKGLIGGLLAKLPVTRPPSPN